MNKINETIEFFNDGEKWGKGDYDIPMYKNYSDVEKVLEKASVLLDEEV